MTVADVIKKPQVWVILTAILTAVLVVIGIATYRAIEDTGPPEPSLSRVTVSSNLADPTVTIYGKSLDPEPECVSPPSRADDTQSCDFRESLFFCGSGWCAGEGAPGQGDFIGLRGLAYTDTQISFGFGKNYGAHYGMLHPGDQITAYVREKGCGGGIASGGLSTSLPC